MEEIFLSKSMHHILFLFVLFALQFFLASRRQKWLGLLLPLWYFLQSFSVTYTAIQAGFRVQGSLLLTAVCLFVTSNTNTVILLLISYFVHPKESEEQSNQEQNEQQVQRKRAKLKAIGEQASTIAISATSLTILTVGLVTVLLGAVLWFSLLANTGPEQAASNTMQYPYHQVSEGEQHGGLPVMLEDLGVEALEYRYVKGGGFVGPITISSNCIDSMVDNVEAPEKEFTLNYTVWRQETIKLPVLLSLTEKTLQVSRDGEISQVNYDYGADKAYWIGDYLLLRYADTLILSDASSTKELLDSETCAAFFREKFAIEEL